MKNNVNMIRFKKRVSIDVILEDTIIIHLGKLIFDIKDDLNCKDCIPLLVASEK
jgi:hypothetical protein